MEAKEVTLKIDDVEVKANQGATILDAAKKLGINIPTLCYSSALEPFGACRICSVEVVDKRGRKRIVTSCNYPVEEGLVVYTKSDKVVKTRKVLLELLLARCPNVTKLQDMAREYGVEKTRFWIGDEQEDCILCGLCSRVCEEKIGVSAINFAKRGVEREVTAPYHEFSNDCIGCGACAIVCPTKSKKLRINNYPTLPEDVERIEQRFLNGIKDEELGVYNDIFAAKSSIGGQDGGVATALLVSGMQRGLFDAAIVVQRVEGYRAEAVVAESVDDILKAKKTKYLRVKMMSKIGELLNKGKKKIAMVGTSCEVRAARKIQEALLEKFPDLELTIIGLFCFESFDYDKLKVETKKLMGIDLDQAEKTQIHKGKYIVTIDGKEYSTSVRDLTKAVENGCVYCDDFTAKLADVSVGSVGSEDGYSTVIVRSEKGKKLTENIDLTRGNVNKEEIAKLSALKKSRAKKNFAPILKDLQVQQPPPVLTPKI
ncbi:MAG: Coenzyme F420 hydrogenase/dehydrogenase, beta subunit C-terminal domain [Candidatus Bathyarchaeota archaeon]|nr:Coenzyme F420 hydrogenase/dehydrogenase, beta subunit C-terminal domain [Candidatus Bathyarchaeota archaeon]